MSILDTFSNIVNKGEQLASDGLHAVENAGSAAVHLGAEAIQKVEQTGSAIINDGKKALDTVEQTGSKLASEALDTLKTAAKTTLSAASAIADSGLSAIFPAGALIKLGVDTFKNLMTGDTITVDKKATLAGALTGSGFSFPTSDGASSTKLNLTSILQQAEPTARSARASDFSLVSASEWKQVLPELMGDTPAGASSSSGGGGGSDSYERTGATTGSADSTLPSAKISQDGIDFGAIASDLKSGKLEISSNGVSYQNKDVDVSLTKGHFDIEQTDGYSFKDDGNGGKDAYFDGSLVYHQTAGGQRQVVLSDGRTVTKDGDQIVVTGKNGQSQTLSINELSHALMHHVGGLLVQQASESAQTAMNQPQAAQSNRAITLGSDFIKMQQGSSTILIADNGEAYVIDGNQAIYRNTQGQYFLQTKGQQAVSFDPSKAPAGLSKDLTDALGEVRQLTEKGSAQVAGQSLKMQNGHIDATLTDAQKQHQAQVTIGGNESTFTDETGTTYTRKANSQSTEVSAPGSAKPLATIEDNGTVETDHVTVSNTETTFSDHSVIKLDGTLKTSTGITVNPENDTTLPDGVTVTHDGVVKAPDGSVIGNASDSMTQQVNDAIAQANAVIARVGSLSGNVTMEQIIELEVALGSISGLVASCSAAQNFSAAGSLNGFSSQIENELSVAKERYAQQQGRAFSTALLPKRNAHQFTKFSFLTAA